MNPSTDTTRHVLVHKTGDEGSIHIDYLTGGIVTPIDERPDWAEGLAHSLPRERDAFYKRRLGEDFGQPTAIAFEDLSWVGVDGEGGLLELSADAEFRSEVVKEFLGIDEETGDTGPESKWHTVAEVEIGLDNERTADEARLIDSEMASGFGSGDVNHAAKKSASSAS